MRTTADECKDRARDYVSQAVTQLSMIVVEQCHGSDQYEPDTYGYLRETLMQLIYIRDNL